MEIGITASVGGATHVWPIWQTVDQGSGRMLDLIAIKED